MSTMKLGLKIHLIGSSVNSVKENSGSASWKNMARIKRIAKGKGGNW